MFRFFIGLVFLVNLEKGLCHDQGYYRHFQGPPGRGHFEYVFLNNSKIVNFGDLKKVRVSLSFTKNR